ncbi:MAG: transketolase family protein [Mesorhizobium sp.]|nr:MAG: transketolase family protein [Mesorhizobium sp.]
MLNSDRNADADSGKRSIQAPFGAALVKLASDHDDIVGLTADLGKYTDIMPFAAAYPDRYFNVGMAEQNLIAVAAGMAKTGKTPFVTTYGVFATRRAYDFIAVACAHSDLNVKIFGALPGLTTSYGASHQAIEDSALMRAIPGLTVIDPCDASEIMEVVHAAYETPGTVYVRLQRGNVPIALPADYSFKTGKAQIVRKGADIGIISTGISTAHALEAAARLGEAGKSAAVLHVPTLKPFDHAAVIEFAKSFGQLATVENHVKAGGLATQVAECLFDAGIVGKLQRIGLPDAFVEYGSPAYLMDKYGISATKIFEALR